MENQFQGGSALKKGGGGLILQLSKPEPASKSRVNSSSGSFHTDDLNSLVQRAVTLYSSRSFKTLDLVQAGTGNPRHPDSLVQRIVTLYSLRSLQTPNLVEAGTYNLSSIETSFSFFSKSPPNWVFLRKRFPCTMICPVLRCWTMSEIHRKSPFVSLIVFPALIKEPWCFSTASGR